MKLMKTTKTTAALLRGIQRGVTAARSVRRAATNTLAACTLLLFALTPSAQADATVTTLAGSAGESGTEDGTGSAARFFSPSGVATDSSGNVYVADNSNHTIRKVTPGGVVTTIAGSAGSSGTADGTGSAARFFFPNSTAVDSGGNVYVADTGNHTIRKVTPSGEVTTIAGFARSSGNADGTGSAARFNTPIGVAVDSSGNVYVGDRNNHTIRKVTPGGVVTTLAGSAGSSGNADGTGSAARFNSPRGVTVDSSGNVYVADRNNHTIRKVTPGGVVTTLAGSAGSSGSADGAGSAARFSFPNGTAVDSSGNVYVADINNYTIRKVTPGGVVTTLAGSAGSRGIEDGTASAARFFAPNGTAVDSDGNVYVADVASQTIRKVTLDAVVTPNSAPTDIALSANSIDENNAPGATIGTLSATDPNSSDTHTFAFAGGADDGAFTITGSTLSINGSADFETKSSYSIRIRATDSGAGNLTFEKNFAVTINDVTIPQIINFAALGGKTLGDAPFNVSATGGASGQPVTFSIVSGPATIAGNTVTLTGAGDVTVRASQAGNADYFAATDVEETFNVAQAGQTIAFGPLGGKTFGDAPFAVSATGGASGQSVTFSIFSGPATIAGSR